MDSECNTARLRIAQAVKLRQLKCWGGELGTKKICDFELNITKNLQEKNVYNAFLKNNHLKISFIPTLTCYLKIINCQREGKMH